MGNVRWYEICPIAAGLLTNVLLLEESVSQVSCSKAIGSDKLTTGHVCIPTIVRPIKRPYDAYPNIHLST